MVELDSFPKEFIRNNIQIPISTTIEKEENKETNNDKFHEVSRFHRASSYW